MSASFDYRTTSGVELRKDRNDARKAARKAGRDEGAPFAWYHRVEGGEWDAGQGGRRPHLYRRAEVEARLQKFPAEPVFWVEGETKADRLWDAGLAATCPPSGAASALKDEDTGFLAGSVVVVVPDMDGPGLKHARGTIEHLRPKAACAVQLDLPGGLLSGEDLMQWLDKYGHSTGELLELALPLIAKALGPSNPTVLALEDFLQEHADPVPSLVGNGAIAKESLNVLAGEPGTGKTLLALNLVLCLAAGKSFLGLHVPVPCRCLFVEAEGNRTRFRERVLTARRSLGLNEEPDIPLFFPPRAATFEIGEGLEAMIKESGALFVVLDTVGLFHEGEENSATDWKRHVVKPLRRIIESTGAAFLLLHHFGKPSEGRTGGHRVRGTSAIKGDVDTLLLLEPAKSGADLRVLTFDKIKNGPPLDSIVVRFDGERALFERTSDDALTALKPRLAEVQRIVLERGEASTAEIKAAIMEELELGRTQAEGLIESACAAGLIERKKRGVYRIPGMLLGQSAEIDQKVPF
jgi:hypothetical protein